MGYKHNPGVQKNMQEKTTLSKMSVIYKGLVSGLAWLLVFMAWIGIVAASRSFVVAAKDYGVLDTRTYLDAGLGYYGLFSFGLAAIAVLFAVKGNLKSDPRLFRFFRLTFLTSILFLIPILLSMVMFVLSRG